MKNFKGHILIGLGLIINAIAIICNQVWNEFPHIIYFSILIFGIILIFLGVIQYRKANNK